MRGLVLVWLLPMFLSHGLAAPRTDSRSGQSDGIRISNPFTAAEEHLSVLHGYLKEQDPLGENDSNMTRETAILHLFVLHDYDKSGLLDGLELMQLLYGVLTRRLQEKPTEYSVISLVDEVLEIQDVNRDGLLSAQELMDSLSFNEEAITDSAHMAIPPPVGGQSEKLPAPMDSHKEETEKPELLHQPAEVNYIPQDPAPPPAESMTSQEEPDVVNNDDVAEEVTNEVELVEMPGEEEEDKPDDEM
ncbi:cell growth regulator with EF hand domain protein 1 [Rhinoderma darwinii]|uniref:cell growth regulator with EF hand domain protein 1 n=1 Tax=Rhinoderma darwinii TaxID=43563 RepID=UPI003F67B49C